MTLFSLLPSPLLGPATWEPVARVLRAGGDEVVLPQHVESAPTSPEDVCAELAGGVPSGRACVVVAHSNAGYFVPALAERRKVVAAIFVDAALPPFAATRTLTAADGFYDFLVPKADEDGLLPVWTRWWDDDLADLFPDPATRRRVEEQQRRFPLRYFRQELDVPSAWRAVPCAYLAFGDTYAEEVEGARTAGWPVTVIEGGHLEMLKRPEVVADEVRRLLAQAPAVRDG